MCAKSFESESSSLLAAASAASHQDSSLATWQASLPSQISTRRPQNLIQSSCCLVSRRESQDDICASYSSRESLERSPNSQRRRSSTISQCSSILSECTRNQLNFDLSPDLAPDSSLFEANLIAGGRFSSASPSWPARRPATPEPAELDEDSVAESNQQPSRPASRMEMLEMMELEMDFQLDLPAVNDE